jgi:cytochrome P450
VTTVGPQRASACPVHDFTPYELKPLGGWTEFYDRLREESPLVKNLFGRSYYIPTRHEDILGVLQDPETFSSESVVAYEPDPAYRWIPHMINGDEHRQWRRQLGPYFSPRAIESIDARVRAKARGLIGELAGRGSCDLMTDFALKFPTAVVLEIVGLPEEDLPYLMTLEEDINHAIGDPGDVIRRKVTAIDAVKRYLAQKIAQRRAEPADDLITKSLDMRIGDRPVTDDELLNWWQFLVQAGLDSVAGMLGYFFHHLATHPADRRRIVDQPETIPAAMEEMMRAFSFIVTGRKVTRDTEIAGCPVAAGSMVQLALKMSGRDDGFYDNAAAVDFDRGTSNHLAFGAGPHRCLGSHLARRELRVALEEWHRLIPDYRLGEGEPITEFGRSSGVNTLPLAWDVLREAADGT